jgi:hypothetical protein
VLHQFSCPGKMIPNARKKVNRVSLKDKENLDERLRLSIILQLNLPPNISSKRYLSLFLLLLMRKLFRIDVFDKK